MSLLVLRADRVGFLAKFMVFSSSISTIPCQRTGPRRLSRLSCTFRAELASNCAAGDGFHTYKDARSFRSPVRFPSTVRRVNQAATSDARRAAKGSGSYCFSAVWLHRVRSIKSKHSLFINPTVDFSGKSLKPCGRPRTMLAQSLYSPNTMSDRKFESREIGVRYRPTIGAPK